MASEFIERISELKVDSSNSLITAMKIIDTSGETKSLNIDSKNNLLVTVADIGTSGSVSSLGGYVELPTRGSGSAIVLVSGTWAGKLEVQGSIDSTWSTLSIVQPTGALIRTGINNDAQNGSYRVAIVGGYTKIRLVSTSWSTGTADVKINASSPVSSVFSFQLNSANLHTTIYQAPGSSYHTSIDSGNNVIGTVSINQSTSGVTNLVTSKFVDTNGSIQTLKWNAESPQVCSQDYLQALAEGDISGHSPTSKLGYGVSVANVEVDLFQFCSAGTPNYVFPTSNMQLQVISSSVQDHTTGAGIRTITIGYLDTGYVAKTTTVNMNGTTVVTTTPADLFRVNRVRAATVGSNGVALGNIHVRSTGGLIYGGIMAGYSRGRTAVYTVPTSKTYYQISLRLSSISGSKVAATLFTQRGTYDDENQTLLTPGIFFMPFSEIGLQDGAIDIPYEIPIKFPQATDIKVSAKSDQAGAILNCGLRGWTE